MTEREREFFKLNIQLSTNTRRKSTNCFRAFLELNSSLKIVKENVLFIDIKIILFTILL